MPGDRLSDVVHTPSVSTIFVRTSQSSHSPATSTEFAEPVHVKSVLELRWRITEGSPATENNGRVAVNRINTIAIALRIESLPWKEAVCCINYFVDMLTQKASDKFIFWIIVYIQRSTVLLKFPLIHDHYSIC